MPVDLGRFNSTLVYSRRAPIKDLLEDLAELRAFDGKQEKTLTMWTAIGVIGLMGSIISIIAASSSNPTMGPTARFALIGAFVAMMVVGFATRWARSRLNLENRRYELAERVIRFLRLDSPPDAEISLQLDLQRPYIRRKQVRTGKVGPWNVTYYTDPWLRVQGRLVDGTAYRLTAIEKHQLRSKTYRSRSGKMKSKSKTKAASELIVGVRVKRRRFPEFARLSTKSAVPLVQLPEWAKLKACKVDAPATSDRGTLTLRSATTQAWSCEAEGEAQEPTSGVRWFAMSILSVYQVLNLARVPEKG
jgi:hypothetical protein